MKMPDFRFFSNKLFLSGLAAGIVITAFVAAVIILAQSPAPDKGEIKGTMAGTTYIPAVGELGIIQATGVQCNKDFNDVIFNNDPNNTVIRCHSDAGAPGMQVEVVSVKGGDFCSGGGIYLSVYPAVN